MNAKMGTGEMIREEYLSPRELSKLLKVSRPWPYVMAKRGRLSYYKIGKVIRFRVTDIQEFLERSRIEKRI
jgi:excisionase family DNA binding protein